MNQQQEKGISILLVNDRPGVEPPIDLPQLKGLLRRVAAIFLSKEKSEGGADDRAQISDSKWTLFDRVFRIPKYQRFYSWERKQRDDLFGDIRELAKKGEDRHHFMATIVCFRTQDVKAVGSLE